MVSLRKPMSSVGLQASLKKATKNGTLRASRFLFNFAASEVLVALI